MSSLASASISDCNTSALSLSSANSLSDAINGVASGSANSLLNNGFDAYSLIATSLLAMQLCNVLISASMAFILSELVFPREVLSSSFCFFSSLKCSVISRCLASMSSISKCLRQVGQTKSLSSNTSFELLISCHSAIISSRTLTHFSNSVCLFVISVSKRAISPFSFST